MTWHELNLSSFELGSQMRYLACLAFNSMCMVVVSICQLCSEVTLYYSTANRLYKGIQQPFLSSRLVATCYSAGSAASSVMSNKRVSVAAGLSMQGVRQKAARPSRSLGGLCKGLGLCGLDLRRNLGMEARGAEWRSWVRHLQRTFTSSIWVRSSHFLSRSRNLWPL